MLAEAVKPCRKLESQAPQWAVTVSMETREKIILMAIHCFLLYVFYL